jgi:hypothetical protein
MLGLILMDASEAHVTRRVLVPADCCGHQPVQVRHCQEVWRDGLRQPQRPSRKPIRHVAVRNGPWLQNPRKMDKHVPACAHTYTTHVAFLSTLVHFNTGELAQAVDRLAVRTWPACCADTHAHQLACMRHTRNHQVRHEDSIQYHVFHQPALNVYTFYAYTHSARTQDKPLQQVIVGMSETGFGIDYTFEVCYIFCT